MALNILRDRRNRNVCRCYHLTASHPDGLGAKLVMRNALEDAGMAPEDIDYINVHGTSTPVAISQRLRRSKMCSENMLIN